MTLTVFENLRAGVHFGSVKNQDEKRIIYETLEFLGLNGKEHTPATNLKLLDKKLTMIAVVLATKPKLLLLDEPMAGLSSAEIMQSTATIKRINQELGIAIVIIEHFMKVLKELSKRLMILESGRMICIGSPADVSKDKKVIECYLGDTYA